MWKIEVQISRETNSAWSFCRICALNNINYQVTWTSLYLQTVFNCAVLHMDIYITKLSYNHLTDLKGLHWKCIQAIINASFTVKPPPCTGLSNKKLSAPMQCATMTKSFLSDFKWKHKYEEISRLGYNRRFTGNSGLSIQSAPTAPGQSSWQRRSPSGPLWCGESHRPSCRQSHKVDLNLASANQNLHLSFPHPCVAKNNK